MNKLEQAARQALEALELAKGSHGVMLTSNPPHDAWLYRGCDYKLSEAITALQELLAEQPKDFAPGNGKLYNLGYDAGYKAALAEQATQNIGDGAMLTAMQHPHNCCVLVDDVSEDSIEQVEQAEQEPVAWGMRASNGAFFTITPEEHDNNGEGLHNIPLYAAPVRTKDLTDDEILKAVGITDPQGRIKHSEFIGDARAVIAADREKNK